jgi:hypothetical protein
MNIELQKCCQIQKFLHWCFFKVWTKLLALQIALKCIKILLQSYTTTRNIFYTSAHLNCIQISRPKKQSEMKGIFNTNYHQY